MRLTADSLRSALGELPKADDAIARCKVVAARLCRLLENNRAESEIVEVRSWAFNVEFILWNGDYWAIECLSPDDFRMYPGLVQGDSVTWVNVWVRDNMKLEELVTNINDVAFRAGKEEFLNA